MSSNHFRLQVDTLVGLGYPSFFGMSSTEFVESLRPLERSLPDDSPFDPCRGTIPFVLVIHSALATTDITLPLISRRGKAALERLYPKQPADFRPIESVQLPEGSAYLLHDIDRGSETLNSTPDAAYATIVAQGRSPLTIEEGIAILTQVPEFLQPNNCFSLLGSRCGDKRVPAFWLSEGRPKLGWCWAGNPHTWLGSASCARRTGSVTLAAPTLAS